MSSLTRSIAKIGGSTLISRVLGFARDLVIARLFGADAATDAFFVAFKIPNFARRLFAEGVFSTALVPVLSECRATGGASALKALVDDITGVLGILLLVVTTLGILMAPALVLAFAPGFGTDAPQHELATAMLRLTLPYVLFVTLTAFAGGILNTFERFGVPAFTPVLLNLVLIACALWLSPLLSEPIMGLAWGVFIAGVAQLAFQLPYLQQLGLLPRPRLNVRDPGIQRLLARMGPAILGVSAAQILFLLNTLLASTLESGSISWLYYAERLMEFPLGVLAVALGTVIVPRLSQQHLAKDTAEFSQTLDWALRWVILLGLPASAGLLALSHPLMATLFLSDEFGAADVDMAAWSLMAYAPGVLALMAIKVLVPGFYARQDTTSPVRAALMALAVGLLLNLALMHHFGHVGLALATSIATGINAILLLRGLAISGVYHPSEGWPALLARALVASGVMAGAILVLAGDASAWLALDTPSRLLRLGAWVLCGAGIYLGLLAALGVRPKHLQRSARTGSLAASGRS